MSSFMEGNSSQSHFFRTLRSKGEKNFLTVVCVEASSVAAAVSIDIPHHFDNPIAFNHGLRSVVDTTETFTPSSDGV
jgi:hypothetical protein